MKFTLKKDDGVKYIEQDSNLIPILLEDGWKCAELEPKKKAGRPKKVK